MADTALEAIQAQGLKTGAMPESGFSILERIFTHFSGEQLTGFFPCVKFSRTGKFEASSSKRFLIGIFANAAQLVH